MRRHSAILPSVIACAALPLLLTACVPEYRLRSDAHPDTSIDTGDPGLDAIPDTAMVSDLGAETVMDAGDDPPGDAPEASPETTVPPVDSGLQVDAATDAGDATIVPPMDVPIDLGTSDTATDVPVDLPRDCASDAACPCGTTFCFPSCRDLEADPAHCGACGHACPAPAGGRAACTHGTCRPTCPAAYVLELPDGGTPRCVRDAAPRLIAPLSTAVTTRARPTLRWESRTGVPGLTGTQVEICRDRACTFPEAMLTSATGSVTPGIALTTGTHYWRARELYGATPGTTWSPVWQFYVRAQAAGVDAGVVTDTSWGSTNDFNGDGRSDLAVSAPYATRAGVYVFHSTPGGLVPATFLPAPCACEYGRVVFSAGDVDGDGFADLGVNGDGCTAAEYGTVDVFPGGPAGVSTTPLSSFHGDMDTHTQLGAAQYGAGDVNGDGYADILIADGYHTHGLLFLGGPLGLRRDADLAGGQAAGAGDFNGDGYADVVLFIANRLVLLAGGTMGPAAASPVTVMAADSEMVTDPVDAISVGDLNGDGRSDLVWGRYSYMMQRGRAYVYYGHATSLVQSTMPALTLEAPGGGGRFGWSVAAAGDLDGDGYADAVIAAALASRGYLYRGGPSGLSATSSATLSSSMSGTFGGASSSRGDLDGNGYFDYLETDAASGRVAIFMGGPGGPPSLPSGLLPDPAGGSDRFGYDVALGRTPVAPDRPAGFARHPGSSRSLALAWVSAWF